MPHRRSFALLDPQQFRFQSSNELNYRWVHMNNMSMALEGLQERCLGQVLVSRCFWMLETPAFGDQWERDLALGGMVFVDVVLVCLTWKDPKTMKNDQGHCSLEPVRKDFSNPLSRKRIEDVLKQWGRKTGSHRNTSGTRELYFAVCTAVGTEIMFRPFASSYPFKTAFHDTANSKEASLTRLRLYDRTPTELHLHDRLHLYNLIETP